MHHYMHKSHSLKMCEYIATVMERWDDLKYFLDYMATDKFNDDDLCDIVKFGSPPVCIKDACILESKEFQHC